jgi:hypothetical protein
MISPRLVIASLFASLLPLVAGSTANAAGAKAVVELFTSQGCSSCPPADEVLAKLATRSDVIALSLPVDYWDYLGWKDTFAQPAFTARQRAYSQGRGDRQVYTPQAVINGRLHANGASVGEIDRDIAATSAGVDVPVALSRTGEKVMVDIGAVGRAGGNGVILVMPVIGKRTVAIGRGENARRSVVYTNIVREVASLGPWSGATSVAVPAALLKDADSVVVVVQSGTADRPGAIVGAAQLALR